MAEPRKKKNPGSMGRPSKRKRAVMRAVDPRAEYYNLWTGEKRRSPHNHQQAHGNDQEHRQREREVGHFILGSDRGSERALREMWPDGEPRRKKKK
jgi:hypothetical protein